MQKATKKKLKKNVKRNRKTRQVMLLKGTEEKGNNTLTELGGGKQDSATGGMSGLNQEKVASSIAADN